MTLLYYHTDCLEHETGNHPECSQRLQCIVDRLRERPSWTTCRSIDVPLGSRAEIERAHTVAHVERMQEVSNAGGGRVEADTVLSQGSYQAAVRAAGAGVDAVKRVMAGESQTAFCAIRPPGHHALPHAPMGFCLFNNISIAARYAIDVLELDRVLIIDWDVHHGNGTQDAFWTDEQVYFFSVHRSPFYPGTGHRDETGSGAGQGTTGNLPLQVGIEPKDFLNRVGDALGKFADRARPQLVLVSAGFDAHALDPVGSLGLDTEHFRDLTQISLDVAKTHAGGRFVSLLEGGYNTEVLPDCVDEHLKVLTGLS